MKKLVLFILCFVMLGYGFTQITDSVSSSATFVSHWGNSTGIYYETCENVNI